MGETKFAHIASRLRAQAYRIGRTTVGRLLRKLGFGLVANRKSLTGAAHPDRNRQFGYIRRVRQQFLQAILYQCRQERTDPLRQQRPHLATPAQVNLHDFPGDALGRAVPYGTMTSPIIKAMSIWATPMIRPNLPPMPSHTADPALSARDKILILCDLSNNCRSWLWKLELPPIR